MRHNDPSHGFATMTGAKMDNPLPSAFGKGLAKIIVNPDEGTTNIRIRTRLDLREIFTDWIFTATFHRTVVARRTSFEKQSHQTPLGAQAHRLVTLRPFLDSLMTDLPCQGDESWIFFWSDSPSVKQQPDVTWCTGSLLLFPSPCTYLRFGSHARHHCSDNRTHGCQG
ncbi:hypothetical protein BR93DRAFT_109601 [Coniochaeta sp. PMI_546]|nr:hypothetical protein BR93DRAFT_109601 [Coniochaeta sp. PMI_546]